MKNILKSIEMITDEKKKYQLASTYKTLKQVDEVITYHNNHTASEKALVVINIYGLLQSLFVGIDSLYSLVIGITNNKFNINVNQNKTLNGLKHIRNDIVGHPTNRKYGPTGVAYSVIDNEKLSYHEFIYDTYIFMNNKMEEKSVVVNLDELKSEYSKEKDIIVNRLFEFMKEVKVTINLDKEILSFYYNSNVTNLNIIRDKFISHYGNVEGHRFLWRLNLVEFTLNWHEDDSELNSFIKFLTKDQTIKLLKINNELEDKYVKLPYEKIPIILRKIYKYLDNHEELIEYTNNLHDSNNPFFESDLNYLLNTVKDPSFLKVLKKIKVTKDYEIVYLLGSTIKNYKKKNK